MRFIRLTAALLAAALCMWPQASTQPSPRGYYRFPALYGQTVAFTSEGDLWQVGLEGGTARRLTTHPGDETHAAFSPDGKTLAFTANYEGPTEVYSMPAGGGLPTRRTYEGGADVVGWTPNGKILYATQRYATLPDTQLATVDSENRVELVPLAQAAQGAYDKTGATLFFTRFPFQGSYSKRYQGGTAQNLWRYAAGTEASPLTADFAGTSKNAMWWNGRVYFLSDRDGTMNLWSMDESGKGLKQLTRHQGWDAKDAALQQGRIVYQMGADLRVYDIAAGSDKVIPIELASDFDHLREHWVKDPFDYASAAHVAPDGSSVVLTSRGRVFVAPLKNGRFVDVAEHKPGRYREARFLDAKNLLVLSTESGEVEFWKVPANGGGKTEQLTSGGKVLRWDGVPSPDGKWIAHQDKDDQFWLFNVASKTEKLIGNVASTDNGGPQFKNVRWSSDSRWLTYDVEAPNQQNRIVLYNVETGSSTPLTTDRYNSRSAAWSADGKWIYFLSDRNLQTVVGSPWGSRAPDPYFDKLDKIYMLALKKGSRSPFEAPDELHPDKPEKKEEPAKPADGGKPADSAAKPGEAAKTDEAKIDIDLDGIAARVLEVPVGPGNYDDLQLAGKRICYRSLDAEDREKNSLQCLDIANKGDKPDTLMEGASGFEVSADGKKILIAKRNDLYVVDATAKGSGLRDPKALSDAAVDLKGWTFSVIPSEEFREAFQDAWRLHRDYFYDKNMHGVNWAAMRDKYGELVNRIRDREELSDLISEMVGELSTLHTFVRGGDIRKGPDQISLSALGAYMVRDTAAGGYVVKHIYKYDSDRPDRMPPLAKPGVDVAEGEVLLAINNQDVLSAVDPAELLRNQTGKQVLLRFRKGSETHEAIVKPIGIAAARNLQYNEWEYTRRLAVEQASAGKIGYVHLRAMGSGDINRWEEEYTPIYRADGLIIDVRHNGGGNIDSWILNKLMRKIWMYWQPRVGATSWNPQHAFRGQLVVLCDAKTASDGEAFTEGFRRLGLGKAIGTRTWGGEIWLSGSNYLADGGVATTGEEGVFGPEGKWLIEGHGVDPDMVVDNLPHATFEGKDAQLEAAIAYLQAEIKAHPLPQLTAPKYPDKSVRYPSTPTGGGRPGEAVGHCGGRRIGEGQSRRRR
ncbi:MAG: S41 family peptidase [Ignavibacteriota bacterium]